MAGESSTKKGFQEDIFAEDEKWLWPRNILNTKADTVGSSYASVPSGAKAESSSCSSDEELGFRADSNSQKRSFRKRESSSASEGNQHEDASSSPCTSGILPHERVLLSMYDDDARSGSPSGTYKKTDLAFMSTFRKEIDPLSGKSPDKNSFQPASSTKMEQSRSSVREHIPDIRNSKDRSPNRRNESPRRDHKVESSKKSPESRRLRAHRSRSHEKKYSDRSRTRSHSRSKERRIKSPHRTRHNSRSRDRRSRSQEHCSRSREQRSCSRERKHQSRGRRSRSRDSRRRSTSRRRRSRSRSYDRHHGSRYRSSSRDRYRRRRYSRSRSRSRGRSGSRNRKPGSLPLSTSGGAMTPQMALQQTMAAMSAKAQALTGIALPKYYNPAAVNPLKYAEQVQKRKLLWQNKEKVEEQPKNSVWDKLTFAQDQDGKMTAKFRKLMGIKSETAAEKEPAVSEDKESVLKKQEELFRDLDQQYEMARMTTHTQRGVGLGYSAQALYPPIQK